MGTHFPPGRPDPREYFRLTSLLRSTDGVVKYIEAIEKYNERLENGLSRIAGIWEHGQDAEASVCEAMDIAHNCLDAPFEEEGWG